MLSNVLCAILQSPRGPCVDQADQLNLTVLRLCMQPCFTSGGTGTKVPRSRI
jgi:hypothetical protein